MHKLGIIETKLDDLRMHDCDKEARLRDLERFRARSKGGLAALVSLSGIVLLFKNIQHLIQ